MSTVRPKATCRNEYSSYTSKWGRGESHRVWYPANKDVWSGEKLSADSEAVVQFFKKFQEVVKNEKLTNDQLYNCDETGLNLKLLPSNTRVNASEQCV